MRPLSNGLAIRGAGLAILCTLLLTIYSSGLGGPFVFDDFPNIVNNSAVAQPDASLSGLVHAAWSGDSGPLKRPLAYLSFAVDSLIAGGVSNTLPFKLTNLLIHIVNALLVVFLATRLSQRAPSASSAPIVQSRALWIGLAAAALWSLHPIQTTPVLHVVQRMTSLAAGFVLLATLVFLKGRELLRDRSNTGWVWMWAGVGLGLLGLSAKENAAVFPALLLAVEYTLYGRDDVARETRVRLRWFYLAICGVPLVAAIAWLAAHPDFISAGYANRDFTLTERLLTEARALWFYLGMIAIPVPGWFTVYHDDFPASTGILHPWTALPALIGIALAVAIAVLGRHRNPLLSLAILWFLVGHTVESTIIGLELVHEHRNYLPDIVLFIALAHGVAHAFTRARVAAAASLVLALIYAGATFVLANVWSREDRLVEFMVRHHPESARTQAVTGELLAYRLHAPDEALKHYRVAMSLAPNEASFSMQTLIAMRRTGTPAAIHSAELQAISDHIVDQLGKRAPSATALGLTASTADCVMDQVPWCRDLYPYVLRWCDAVLDNPRVPHGSRLIALDRALYLATGSHDFESAFDALARAKKAEPENKYYIFLEADLYMRRGDAEHAKQILATLPKDGELGPEIARLRADIDTAEKR
ncbi:MAG: tetratricopeptide repeat protein [Sulfurifustis sp.]